MSIAYEINDIDSEKLTKKVKPLLHKIAYPNFVAMETYLF